MRIKRSIVAISLAIPCIGFAQEKKNEGYLEEVLVTAQKRVQSVQDIPVAVTSYTGEQLLELGVTDVFDLQNSAPGLLVGQNQHATTSNFSIRGIGTGGQNFGLESSVGLYVDGVYRARQSSVINELVDMERVEVLRGPQGTLFGRNTPSGAILMETVKPNHDAGGYINFTLGNLGLVSLDGAFGGSLVDDVWAYRATVFGSKRDGYVDAIGFGDDLINDRDRAGGRFQLLYTPNDDFSARLIVDYSEIDEVCCSAVTLRNNTFSFNGTPGSDFLLSRLGGDIVSEDRVFDDVVNYNQLPISENEDQGVSLQLDWGLGGGTLTSISAFRSFDTLDDIDGDFSNVPLFSRINTAEQDSFSQEVRFAKEGDKLDYVVGLYYFTQELNSRTETRSEALFSSFLSANPLVDQLFNGYNQANASLGGILPPPANPLPPGTSARDFARQDHDAYAVFGQLDYDFTDELVLTLGMRYTDEKKELKTTFEQDNSGPAVSLPAILTGDPRSIVNLAFPGWGYTIGGPLVVLSERPDVDEELNDEQVTGTAKLSWFADDNTMYFLSYGTGYKSGGTNTDRINPLFDVGFDAETSEAFEIGMKKDFPQQNLRLNVTLHATNTDDFQTNAFSGNGFNLVNAGEVEARGGEIELWWYPTDTLKINGAVVINDAEYKTFERANCWIATPFLTGRADPGLREVTVTGDQVCSRTGERLDNNPEEIFILSATKDFVVQNKPAYFNANYYYRSENFEDGNNDPLKEQDGYGVLSLKAGILFDNGNTEVSLWGRNVLDKDYHGVVFDVPLQDGKLNAYSREPRTYGLSIRKSF